MARHFIVVALAAGLALALGGRASARETQLAGIKLGQPMGAVTDMYGDPNRITPIFNLFRPPQQSGGGSGGSGGSGGMGAAPAEDTGQDASQFLTTLGWVPDPVPGATTAPMGGPGGSGSGSGMMGMPGAPAATARPKQTYSGKIASTQPEVYASWLLIPPRPRSIKMMGLLVALAAAGGAPGGGGGAMGGSGGGMMSSGGGSGMAGTEIAAGPASMKALSGVPGFSGGGQSGGAGGGGMSGGGGASGGDDAMTPIATAWVFERPREGLTYMFFAGGGRVSLISVGDDLPYSITKGGKKPVAFMGTDRAIKSSRGIELGDPMDKVILTYGWPESTEFLGNEILLRYFGRQGIGFTFRQNVLRVTSITVKSAGE